MSIAVAKKIRKRPVKREVTRNGTGVSMTIIADDNAVQVPSWVQDLTSFRAWLDRDDVAEDLPAYFFNGGVWIDMSKEQIFSHVRIKCEYTFVLGGLARSDGRGEFMPDGLRLSNLDANLSTKPDGTYFLLETRKSGRIHLVEGKKGGFVEILGTPDMVLEIVSDSSVMKDLVTLRELYWKAGIPEYWLVDVRGDEEVFEIYRHAAKGYVAARKHDGWMKSNVFEKSFRLVRLEDEFGDPKFRLDVK